MNLTLHIENKKQTCLGKNLVEWYCPWKCNDLVERFCPSGIFRIQNVNVLLRTKCCVRYKKIVYLTVEPVKYAEVKSIMLLFMEINHETCNLRLCISWLSHLQQDKQWSEHSTSSPIHIWAIPCNESSVVRGLQTINYIKQMWYCEVFGEDFVQWQLLNEWTGQISLYCAWEQWHSYDWSLVGCEVNGGCLCNCTKRGTWPVIRK